jgi:tyrosine-protein phosphatase YwqE
MIDTHLHILPGVDDGPETMEESLILAQALVQEGIRYAIATPHYNDEFPRRSAAEIRERVYHMQQELDRHGIPLRLFAGHEALLRPELIEDIQLGRVATLNGSSYLLLELWTRTWLPETERLIFHLRAHGIIPIIAHPERYHVIQQDPGRLAALLQQGALAQLTASSLTGLQGNTVRCCAETLLKQGLIHCIASDAHGLHRRPPNVMRGLERAVELVGQGRVDQMIKAQPAAIINNQVPVNNQVPRATSPNIEDKHMRAESRQEIFSLARSYEKQRSKKKGYLLFVALCLVGLLLSSVGYGTYTTTYSRDIPLAQVGVQHLQKALTLLEMLQHNPFDASTVSNAQQEFTGALNSFVQVHNDVQWIPEISTSMPLFGTRLSGALHLLPLALELSQIGVASCTGLGILISKMRNPLNAQDHGLTMVDLALLHQAFEQVKTILGSMIDQINHLTPTDLQIDPRVAKVVTNFRQNIPALQQWVETAEQLFTVAPALLGIGTPANYLIEVLDSTELRPGGGFIGNYGIATFSGGLLTSTHITDTYLLDRPFEAAGHSIPYPPAYSWFDLAPGSWSLRDSNLDADFPTAAQYAEQNYAREGGNVPLQGVIAFTPALIQQALSITGPLSIPEYHEVVTANNLIDRIHYYQGAGSQGADTPSPDGISSVRKHFLAVVSEHFLARIHQLPSSELGKFLQLAVSSIHTKDLQIYFNSTIVEALLHTYHIDSSIEPPMGDGLFVVDANISASKDNQFIVDTIHDRVTLDQEGNAHHSTTINYKWRTGIPGENSFYRDYVHIYVPPASTFQMQNGWDLNPSLYAFGYQGDAFGYKVVAGLLLIPYGQSGSITLTWTVPGAASKDTQGWHYQYLIQRQAGAQQVLDLQVMFPSCARVTSQEGMVLSQNRQVANLTEPLTENVAVGVDYTC